ncbi:MAG: B12-binding domain-containing radical SAM protein [Saccharofermentanales bacterium]
MKIILVALNATYCHTNLAVRYIDAYLRRHFNACPDIELGFIEFSINDSQDRIMDALYEEHADIYGFSCYIWNISLILQITSDLKLALPGCLIILGGPEVTYEQSDFFIRNPQADYLIQGQGMKSFTDLVERLTVSRTGYRRDAADGLETQAETERIIQGEPAALDELEFPYADIDAFQPEKQYYYESSIGCPYHCSYCLSSAQTGVDSLSAGRVRNDLLQFVQKGEGIVKLVDRTFNFDDERAAVIWKDLIDLYNRNPFTTIFHFEIAADLLQDETMKLLLKAPKGIFRFECGVQSTSSDVLKNVNRKTDQEKLMRALRILSANGGIELHVDLIAGLPGEDIGTFIQSFNDVYALHPAMLQLGFLKMLKGSKIREDAVRFGIVSSSYPPYIVIRTDAITFNELSLLKRLEKVLDAFYNSGQFRYSLRFLMDCSFRDDPFALFRRLTEDYQASGGFDRTFSRKDRIGLFYRFGIRLLSERHRVDPDDEASSVAASADLPDHAAIFTDLLKFDYYRFDKKGGIPELKINYSESHPMMTREETAAFMNDSDGNRFFSKARIERYAFDAGLLMAEDRIIPGDSFVLYDMSGDRPVIKKTLKVN